MDLHRPSSLLPLFLAAALPLASPSAARGGEQNSTARLMKLLAKTRCQQYVAPTPNELERCEQLFSQTLSQTPSNLLVSQWDELGFVLEPLDELETIWVIREKPDLRRGWGCYLIKPSSDARCVIQAPHRFADKHTGRLLVHAFADGDFKAAAMNTTNRRQVDVAHTADHPFTVFTQVVVRDDGNRVIAQLHGFAREKRKSNRAALADMVISNGTRYPERWIRRCAVVMQSGLPFARVELFPTGVNELGATTNVQGEAIRQLGSLGFIHFEMSLQLRLRLLSDARSRDVFLKKLLASAD